MNISVENLDSNYSCIKIFDDDVYKCSSKLADWFSGLTSSKATVSFMHRYDGSLITNDEFIRYTDNIEHKSNQFESVEILLPKGKPIKGYLFSARLDVENPEKSRLISNILLCFQEVLIFSIDNPCSCYSSEFITKMFINPSDNMKSDNIDLCCYSRNGYVLDVYYNNLLYSSESLKEDLLGIISA